MSLYTSEVEAGHVLVRVQGDRLLICCDEEEWEMALRHLPSLRAALNTPLTAREVEEEEARAERKAGDMTEEVSR